jgi:hypothetical protein
MRTLEKLADSREAKIVKRLPEQYLELVSVSKKQAETLYLFFL